MDLSCFKVAVIHFGFRLAVSLSICSEWNYLSKLRLVYELSSTDRMVINLTSKHLKPASGKPIKETVAFISAFWHFYIIQR